MTISSADLLGQHGAGVAEVDGDGPGQQRLREALREVARRPGVLEADHKAVRSQPLHRGGGVPRRGAGGVRAGVPRSAARLPPPAPAAGARAALSAPPAY
eukprot:1487021-Pyramimonas_sp.AAC.3